MRYDDRLIKLNNSPIYRTQFLNRGVKFINQYGTPILQYPTPSEIAQLDTVGHVWGLGDRFYKLSQEHYGNAKYWWVIAWFNQTPTEFHLSAGTLLMVPKPLYLILDFFDL